MLASATRGGWIDPNAIPPPPFVTILDFCEVPQGFNVHFVTFASNVNPRD
jgi:hypothetical protein